MSGTDRDTVSVRQDMRLIGPGRSESACLDFDDELTELLGQA